MAELLIVEKLSKLHPQVINDDVNGKGRDGEGCDIVIDAMYRGM